MKIAYETVFAVPMESVWDVIRNFEKYPQWNPVMLTIEGETIPESVLKISLKLSGSRPINVEATVTGFAEPKYFSFETRHRLGKWFYQEEWILRMKEGANGTNVIAEAYVTGLSLRFRRSKVEDAFRRSLFNMIDALKERINQQGQSQ